MKKLLLASWVSLIPLGSLAQQMVPPEIYYVQNVAPGKKLEVRTEPRDSASVLVEVIPDSRGFEVVTLKDNWGRINVSEKSGWVDMHYLTRNNSVWEGDKLPATLKCAGQYWDLNFTPTHAKLRVMDLPDQNLTIDSVTGPGGQSDVLRTLRAGNLTLMVQSKACDDGASDRDFGLAAVVRLPGSKKPHLTGCCSIAPQ